jgi:acyl dehydratase
MQPAYDIAQGDICDLGRIEIMPEAALRFAAAYDPQLHHLDAEAARATPLQGLAASGWLTCALLTRQVERQLEEMHVTVPAIDDIRWLQPVRPGDVLDARLHWRSRCESPACRNSGGWIARLEASNQSGDAVLHMHCNILLAPRRLAPGDVWKSGIDCALHRKRIPRAPRRSGGHLVRYFEDVELGDEIALGSCLFTEESVRAYASMVEDAARGRELRRDTVHGWHIVSAWMRQIVDYYHAEADWLSQRRQPVPLLGPAAGARNLSWCRPVREGDRIAFTSWAEHKVNIGTSSEWGLLVAGTEGINQDGEVVVSLYPQFLLQKRPA